MQDFSTIIDTRPQSIRAVFVADLHLSEYTPMFNHAFLVLLSSLTTLPHLHEIYILGDWLDAWIGDDEYFACQNPHWLTPILLKLHQLSHRTKLYIMHGNRDFALGQKLCKTFNGKLIDEPYFIYTHNTIYRLEHGDKLCTDDTSYQRYRFLIRSGITKQLLLNLPLAKRRALAHRIKHHSTHQKTQKPQNIMDVNQLAVLKALQTCDTLIHGHTHRPYHHQYGTKDRVVLGDWQYNDYHVKAVIGVMTKDGFELCQATLPSHPSS